MDNVGTVAAALSVFLACQQYKPDLIISVGTAGGFRAQGAAVGDVFVGTTTVNHDRRIPIPVLQNHTHFPVVLLSSWGKVVLPIKLGLAYLVCLMFVLTGKYRHSMLCQNDYCS